MRYILERAVLFSIILLVFAIILFMVASWPLSGNDVARSICVSIAATLVSIAAIRIFYEAFASRSLTRDFKILEDSVQSGLLRIFLPGYTPDWHERIERASKITMFGITLRLLENRGIIELLTRKVNEGHTVTLVLCDPRSVTLLIRYWKDEPRALPSDWPGGLVHQAQHIEKLHNWRKDLQRPSNLNLKLFQGYPSMAIFCFDEELYYYSYPYRARGIHGPVFVFHRNSPISNSLKKTLQQISDDSIDLSDTEVGDIREKRVNGDFGDEAIERKLERALGVI